MTRALRLHLKIKRLELYWVLLIQHTLWKVVIAYHISFTTLRRTRLLLALSSGQIREDILSLKSDLYPQGDDQVSTDTPVSGQLEHRSNVSKYVTETKHFSIITNLPNVE